MDRRVYSVLAAWQRKRGGADDSHRPERTFYTVAASVVQIKVNEILVAAVVSLFHL